MGWERERDLWKQKEVVELREKQADTCSHVFSHRVKSPLLWEGLVEFCLPLSFKPILPFLFHKGSPNLGQKRAIRCMMNTAQVQNLVPSNWGKDSSLLQARSNVGLTIITFSPVTLQQWQSSKQLPRSGLGFRVPLLKRFFIKGDLSSGFKCASVSSATGAFYGVLDCTEQTNSSKLLAPLFSFPSPDAAVGASALGTHSADLRQKDWMLLAVNTSLMPGNAGKMPLWSFNTIKF